MLTQQEEDILRLMIAELITRKKLDAERKAIDTEIRTTVNPLSAQIIASHKTTVDILTADYLASEKAIEDNFKV